MVSVAVVSVAVASVAAVGKALVGGCLTMRTHHAGLHSPCVQHTMQVMEAEEFVRRLCAPRGNGGDERVYMQALTHYGPTHYGPTYHGPTYHGPTYHGPTCYGPAHCDPTYHGPTH
eukprot:scaffold59279_cov57-Phaeocystis_antarctica.AAC.1